MLKLIQTARSLSRLGDCKHTLSTCISQRAKLLSVRFHSGTEATKNAELDIESLTQGDAELQHKYKVLLLETEVMRQEGRNVPPSSFLNVQHWQQLLTLKSRTARLKYLEFLFKLEKKKEHEQIKKEKKRLEREQQERVSPSELTDHIVYALGHNHLFLRFYDTTINDLYNWKLLEALQFGPKLVVDCGFNHKMTNRESTNCAKQLMLLFSENRAHQDPFDLHFCNIDPKTTLMRALHQNIRTMYEPWFPMNLHEKNYLDVFPKEQLVYLTPHCKTEMKNYDHDSIYIIGGIVDKTNSEPLSLAKAKEQGLRMAKLPLERYLPWGTGASKTLTLNQVTSILLDIKQTDDWKHALRHVPRRKLMDVGADTNKTFAADKGFNAKQFRTSNLNLSYKGNRQDSREIVARRRRDMRSIFNE